MKTSKYDGCDFYAEVNRAGGVAGTVLIVSRTAKNGTCRKALAAPKGQPRAMIVPTWVSPKYLKKCVQVTEGDARRIHPAMFETCKAYEQSERYRATLSRAVRATYPERYPLQPVTVENNVGGGFAVDFNQQD
jgi:hypothetical protein